MFLVVVVKKTRNTDQDVTIYNFNFENGDDEEIDGELCQTNSQCENIKYFTFQDASSLLHISQVVKKAPGDGDPALVS